MKIVLASNNQGKLQELRALLAPLGVQLLAQGQFFSGEAPEPHDTFIENALAKARFAAVRTGLPAIADDAGLCLAHLGGLPGVHTADWCTRLGYAKSDDNNVRALLEQMHGVADRRASMVSVLVGVRHSADPEPLIASGRVCGQIAQARCGSGGFGFDPVMYLPEVGQTFAQMSLEAKHAHSHRGRAARRMLELVRAHWLPAAREQQATRKL